MKPINHQKQKHRNVNGSFPTQMQTQTTMQTNQPSLLPAFAPESLALPTLTTHCAPAPVANSDVDRAPSDPIDHITAWRIESLKRKQRADSFYNSLSSDEGAKLFAWMNELKHVCDIQERIASPPPEGLGRKVSLTCLRRLRAIFKAEIFIDETEETLDMITDLESESDLTQTSRIQTAINHLLHEKAYQLAMTHPGSDVLKDVLTSIEKLSTLEYRRHKIFLERERHHRHNTAPTPTQHHHTQHHTVDLNIVPPNPTNSRQPVTIQTEPHPESNPGSSQQLPPPIL